MESAMQTVLALIEDALLAAREEQAGYGRRELALVITKLEEAQMWAERVK